MATGFPVKANYATGDVLTAANMNDLSGTVNYLQYMPPRNPVLNSNFSVWQRGTSIAMTTTAYCADRWQGYRGVAGGTVSRQATGDTTNLPFIQYCARVQRDSGNTSTSLLLLQYTQETVNSIPYAGKTITFSFYARAGANFSSASNNLEVNLASGTGTDENGITGFTGAVGVINAQQSTLTTTWQRFSYTASVGATATQLTWGFRYTPSGTAGAADYFEITGVQLELGSVANTYMPSQPTYQGELAACQRYYQRQNAAGVYTQYGSLGTAVTTGIVQWLIPFPVTMRTSPSSLEYSNLAAYSGASGVIATPSSVAISQASSDAVQINFNKSASFTQDRPYEILSNNTTSSYIGWSAEL